MEQRTFALACILVLTAGLAAGKYSGGTGEPNDPYLIATAEDLNDIGSHTEDFNKCFVMVNDINLADYDGTRFSIIGNSGTKFTGVFDGNNRTICNFTYQTNSSCVGLFGYVDGPNAIVKELILIDPNVDAGTGWNVGALVGLNDGRIVNCSVLNGTISGRDAIGGMVGSNWGVISDSNCIVSVNAPDHAGAIVGKNWHGGLVQNCRSSGNVTVDYSGAGGIAGVCENGSICGCWSNCNIQGVKNLGGIAGSINAFEPTNNFVQCSHFTGSVSGTGTSVGGIAGRIYIGRAERCSSFGNISGGVHVGGVVGGLTESHMKDCYSFGFVSASIGECGGLAGYEMWGTFENCFSQSSVSGPRNIGFLLGKSEYSAVEFTGCFWQSQAGSVVDGVGNIDPDPNGVIEETPENLKRRVTFTSAGWDFVEVWDIGENQTYPFLRQYLAGDVNHDGIVDWEDYAILASRWLEGSE
jgi:hypothetical protein